MLIPDYYRGDTAEKYFMTGQLGKFLKIHTKWEKLGRIICRAGNGGVKVREFVDIFCAHSPKPRQSGRRNQQNFTTPNADNPTSDNMQDCHSIAPGKNSFG